jgi:S-adenosylmethionine synthetase
VSLSQKEEYRMGTHSALRPEEYLFTSESVSEGHPDKICDQISDAILDEFLRQDPESRVGVETLVTTNKIIIAGEVRGPSAIDKKKMEEIARRVVKDIGYEQAGFHWKNADVEVLVHGQSVDIAQGVDENSKKEEGAGDQGLMFGYACDETDVYMPAPIFYAHRILENIAAARHKGEVRLGPDSKSQVTMVYNGGEPVRIASLLVSTQHIEGLSQQQVREIIRPYVEASVPKGWMCSEENFLVNPTGKFVIGGPDGDCGLTGRKIIVDSYGGAAPHGGGAFSGKDPTKVDRSAAYMARYLAKNIVAAGLAGQCDIQLAYAIGVAQPVSFYVNTFKSSKISNHELEKYIREEVDLTPKGIRKHLQLNRPIYRKTATYGHFGRHPDNEGHFPWEKLDLVDKLKTLL